MNIRNIYKPEYEIIWFLDEIILEETIFNPFLLTLLEQAKMAYKLPKNVNNGKRQVGV